MHPHAIAPPRIRTYQITPSIQDSLESADKDPEIKFPRGRIMNRYLLALAMIAVMLATAAPAQARGRTPIAPAKNDLPSRFKHREVCGQFQIRDNNYDNRLEMVVRWRRGIHEGAARIQMNADGSFSTPRRVPRIAMLALYGKTIGGSFTEFDRMVCARADRRIMKRTKRQTTRRGTRIASRHGWKLQARFSLSDLAEAQAFYIKRNRERQQAFERLAIIDTIFNCEDSKRDPVAGCYEQYSPIKDATIRAAVHAVYVTKTYTTDQRAIIDYWLSLHTNS